MYSLYPEVVVSVKIRHDDADRDKTIVRAGHSIFNRNFRVNVGQMFSAFEAGGPRTKETEEIDVSSAPVPPGSSTLIEPLSERELEVLGLLVEGQTYQEIDQALYLSINTVKTHLKNIYGKLGVSNRREATVKARELNLLR